MNEQEESLKSIAKKIGFCIIIKTISENEGVVEKDMPVDVYDSEFILQLLNESDRVIAEKNPEKLTSYLEISIKNQLRWFDIEGFCQENEDNYKFYTKNQVEEMLKELYNA